MHRFDWFRRLVLICLVVSLATACSEWGGSSGDSSGENGGMDKVAVGVTSLNSLHLWLIVARDEKLMEPSGVKLDVVTFQNTGQIIPAIISGSVNFGMATPEQLFGAQDKQPSLKMVAAEITNDPYQLIVNPKKGIKSLQDLRGKTIGVTGTGASADYFTAKLLLKGHGLEENRDYHFTNAGPPPERATALVNGQVDAVMSFPPDAQVMLRKGMKSIAQASALPNLHKIIMGSLISDQKWYGKNRALAVKFLRGYLASVKWLYDPKNKAKAVADIAKEMKVSTGDATTTYDTFIKQLKASPLDGTVDPSFLTTTAKNAKSEGLKAAPSLDSLSARYDNSLVKAAAKGQ